MDDLVKLFEHRFSISKQTGPCDGIRTASQVDDVSNQSESEDWLYQSSSDLPPDIDGQIPTQLPSSADPNNADIAGLSKDHGESEVSYHRMH